MRIRNGIAALFLVATLSGNLAAQPSDFRLAAEASTSLERLSGGRADWHGTAIDVRAENSARQSYYGRVQATERFSLKDSEAMLGSYQPIEGPWALQIEASASPTHKILARDSLLAQVDYRFGDGWGVQAGYRRSAYENTDTDLLIATVERYFSNYRAAYSLYLGRPDGSGFGPSHRFQWSYYYSDRSSLGVSASAGTEVESISPGGVFSSRVRSLSLAGRHEFAPNWFLSYEWLTQHQGDLYTRNGLRLGIRHAF